MPLLMHGHPECCAICVSSTAGFGQFEHVCVLSTVDWSQWLDSRAMWMPAKGMIGGWEQNYTFTAAILASFARIFVYLVLYVS